MADRQAELLPVPYFHVVVTMPACVAQIALQNKAIVYDILFKAAAETVRVIGSNPKHLGAETGMIAVLHSWGQALVHHPHLHCIVPGGGIAPDGHWAACRPGFFLPVRVLSRLYRRLFLERLEEAFADGRLSFFGDLASLVNRPVFDAYLQPLRRSEWLVYAKRPFGGPEQVLEYLGRYTHRVAIANSRLVELANGQVRFRWKDYRSLDKPKVMTLAAGEFIRRFLLHVLPDGFRRIRHSGFLANGHRTSKLAIIRKLIVLAAAAGPFLLTLSPLATDGAQALAAPSAAHWFGTDEVGRDIFARVIAAAPLDLGIAISAVALSFAIGSVVGTASGFTGGWLDGVVTRVVDTLMAFPLFLLAMAIVSALGNNTANVIYATAVVNLPFYIRMSRAEAARLRAAGFIEAARTGGRAGANLLAAHVYPNVLPPLAIQVSLNLGWAILNAAGLSFLGLGVRPPTPEWGIMVADGAALIVSGAWWVSVFPGCALMLTVLCFNLMGDGVRDLLDPRRRA